MSFNLYCLMGMQFKDFSIIASDQTIIQNIFIMSNDHTRLHEVSDRMVVGVVGEGNADEVQFIQFISKNIDLYRIRNGYGLDSAAVVHFIRRGMTESLRSRKPWMINMLCCGYSEAAGGELYTFDFLASCMKVPFASHGYCALPSLAIMDRYYKPTLTETEAYDIIKMCIHQIHQRFFVRLPNFQVKVVSKDGIKTMPTINAATFLHSK